MPRENSAVVIELITEYKKSVALARVRHQSNRIKLPDLVFVLA